MLALLLFMIPVTTNNIKREYDILLRELEAYNPELLEKQRVIAITKCDLVDEKELVKIQKKLLKSLPDNHLQFISAVSGQGLQELKDTLWNELNADGYKKVIEISHSPIDIKVIGTQTALWDADGSTEEDTPQTIYLNEEDNWDISKYKGIGWDE